MGRAAVNNAGQVYDRGLNREMLRPRYWPSWARIGFLYVLYLLPRSWRDRFAAGLSRLVYRYGHKRREVALTNLRLCFPELSEDEREALARRHMRIATQCLLDYGSLWWLPDERLKRLVEIRGLEHLEDARRRGRNLIVLAPHFIALDYGGIVLTGYLPAVSMFKSIKDPLADWMVYRARTRFGAQIVERGAGLRPLIRPIREGKYFYYLPDEDLGPEHSVFVPFFGVPAATLPTLGRLAQLCDAEVFPCLSRYVPERGRYELEIRPSMQGFPTGDEIEDARRMNEAVEDVVRAAPENYMWTLKRFRTRPPGEPRVY
jgi:lipid A biosynthesis (KDO)2-(lauroyl)-lipid IVA acyltransferase